MRGRLTLFGSSSTNGSSADTVGEPETLKEGAHVEFFSKKSGHYDKGRVSEVSQHGTYKITIDDRVEEVKRESIIIKPHTSFPRILQFHHLVFFGGLKPSESYDNRVFSFNYLKRWAIPAIWITLATVGLITHYANLRNNDQLSTYKSLVITGMWIEMGVNYVYAAQYLQIDDLREIVELLPLSKLQDEYVRYLSYIWGGALVLGILYTVLDASLYVESLDPNELMTDIFISLIGYFNTFYICGIWNWSVMLYYKYFLIDVIVKLEDLNQDEDLTRFKASFRRFSDLITKRTQLWKNNHAVRIVTGLVIAIGYTQLIYYQKSSLEIASPAFFMSCYYCSIWGTIYCAAYVNDDIIRRVMHKLSDIVWEKKFQKDDAADLMDTLPVIFTGLNVAGYPMTTGLALTVGSTVISVILAFTKLHTLTNIIQRESQ